MIAVALVFFGGIGAAFIVMAWVSIEIFLTGTTSLTVDRALAIWGLCICAVALFLAGAFTLDELRRR